MRGRPIQLESFPTRRAQQLRLLRALDDHRYGEIRRFVRVLAASAARRELDVNRHARVFAEVMAQPAPAIRGLDLEQRGSVQRPFDHAMPGHAREGEAAPRDQVPQDSPFERYAPGAQSAPSGLMLEPRRFALALRSSP